MDIYNCLEYIKENEIQQNKTINMVPSENTQSLIAKLPLLFDLSDRYFFNDTLDESNWNFRGNQNACLIETDIVIPLIKKFAKCNYVNVRPISGLNCMMLVIAALGGKKGSTILTVSPEQGGHYATADVAKSLGYKIKYLEAINEYFIDYKKIKSQLLTEPISLIYIDQSHLLFPIDIEKISKIVKKYSPNTIIHVDASHILGLIFGNVLPNPLECGADSFGGSTHKTYPGPQRGLICTNSESISMRIKEKQFFMISNHHYGTIASLAISLQEFKQYGNEYALQIIKNAKRLASALCDLGLDVKGKEFGYTECHQVWVDTSPLGIDSYSASERLHRCGINVNALDEIPCSDGFVLRIGVNEITKLGAKETEIIELANIMKEAITESECVEKLQTRVFCIKNKISSFCNYSNDYKMKKIIADIFDLFMKTTT